MTSSTNALPKSSASTSPTYECRQSSSNQQQIAQAYTVDNLMKLTTQSRVAKDISSCTICEDGARYMFYGTRACDSCRTFFRRHIVLNSSTPLRCRFKGNCDLRLKNRKFCPACRLAKCRSVGMKSELVASQATCFEVSSAVAIPNENSSNSSFGQSNKRFGPGFESNVFCDRKTSIPVSMPPCDFTIKSGDNYVILRQLGQLQISKIQELAFAGNEFFNELIPIHLEPDVPAKSTEAFMATLKAGAQKVLSSLQRLAFFASLDLEDLKLMSKDCITSSILSLSLFALDSTMSYWTTTCFQPSNFLIPNRLSVECLRLAEDGNQLYENYMRLVRTFREVPIWRRDPFFLSLMSATAVFTPRQQLNNEDLLIRDRQVYASLIGRYLEEIFGRRRSSECNMAMATMHSCLALMIELREQFSQIEMGFDL